MIYVITYASYLQSLYTESKVAYTLADAYKQYQAYIADVCETEGMEYDEQDYEGTRCFEHHNPFNGNVYEVKIESHETGNDTEVIDKFIQMLDNNDPSRFDAADLEHLYDKVKSALEYIDTTNNR